MLSISDLCFNVNQKIILHKVNLDFLPGKMNFILGPNGSGKSTFIKICSRQLDPTSGIVEMDGISIANYRFDDLAKMRAVLSQQPLLDFPLTVSEVVMMGRYPHFDIIPSKIDHAICEEVMKTLQLESIAQFPYLKLSGGEKQRVQFARVLAQIWNSNEISNRYIFLDEPFNNLDIKYQMEFVKLLKNFVDEKTILVASLHDLNMAIQFADQIVIFKNGMVYSNGNPVDVMTPGIIKEVFEVDINLIASTDDKSKFIQFT